MSARPQNVGIKAIEIYFPSQVRQICAQDGVLSALGYAIAY